MAKRAPTPFVSFQASPNLFGPCNNNNNNNSCGSGNVSNGSIKVGDLKGMKEPERRHSSYDSTR
jgi:hypothetical protein